MDKFHINMILLFSLCLFLYVFTPTLQINIYKYREDILLKLGAQALKSHKINLPSDKKSNKLKVVMTKGNQRQSC